MELRAYASIFARRWLAILMLPLAMLVVIAIFEQSRETNFTAQARISVSRLSGEQPSTQYQYDDYYDLLSSDFIVDDTVEIVRGNVFAAAVAKRLAEQGINIDASAVEGALDASREHRILTIVATANDQGLAVVIANVASLEIREDFSNYLGVEGDPYPVTMRPVDVPVNAKPDDLRVKLTYLMAIIVAGGFGILLALGLEYFDKSINVDSAEDAIGLDVLAVVREERA
jgi:capsular polysaccharide biosynthesis protein